MSSGQSSPRVGVLYEPGGTWDRVAPAMAAAFRSHGADVSLIGAHVGWAAEKAANVISRVHRLEIYHGPLLMLRNARARGVMARTAPVDFWIQLGSTLPNLAPQRYGTFEDMTVSLGLKDELFSHLDQRTRRSWLARQQRAYAGAERCYVASDWAAESVRRDFDVDPEKLSVIGIGHDLPVPTSPPAKDWEKPTFLWVGKDWERKHGEQVLRAFAQIRAQHPTATLHLAGEHPPISAEGVSAHGRLVRSDPAQTAKLAELFSAATCFVMPSRLEPFGLVYLEAGTYGAASIGTTAGGAPTAVGDGGVCVDPDDDAALQAAMAQMCDPATARAYGEAGARHSNRFTWSHITGQMLLDFS